VQMIVSRQACASGVGDSTVVDLEAHLPYDMRTETAIAPPPGGRRGALNEAALRRRSRAKVGMGGGRLRTKHVRLRRGVVYGRA
jgi:hypothetical protein